MVERRDDLDLVYECPAGRYLYPTNLVTTGQAKASCYKPACRKEKKKLEKSSQTQLPSCVWRRVARAGFEPLFFLFSLSIMYPRHTLPYLTLPDLTFPYLTLPMLPIETRNIPKKPLYPNSNSTRSRSLGGADKPSSKGSVVPPKYLGSLFKKIRCTILSTYLPTCRYGTFYQVKLYLLSPPISFSRSMQRCI